MEYQQTVADLRLHESAAKLKGRGTTRRRVSRRRTLTENPFDYKKGWTAFVLDELGRQKGIEPYASSETYASPRSARGWGSPRSRLDDHASPSRGGGTARPTRRDVAASYSHSTPRALTRRRCAPSQGEPISLVPSRTARAVRSDTYTPALPAGVTLAPAKPYPPYPTQASDEGPRGRATSASGGVQSVGTASTSPHADAESATGAAATTTAAATARGDSARGQVRTPALWRSRSAPKTTMSPISVPASAPVTFARTGTATSSGVSSGRGGVQGYTSPRGARVRSGSGSARSTTPRQHIRVASAGFASPSGGRVRAARTCSVSPDAIKTLPAKRARTALQRSPTAPPAGTGALHATSPRYTAATLSRKRRVSASPLSLGEPFGGSTAGAPPQRRQAATGAIGRAAGRAQQKATARAATGSQKAVHARPKAPVPAAGEGVGWDTATTRSGGGAGAGIVRKGTVPMADPLGSDPVAVVAPVPAAASTAPREDVDADAAAAAPLLASSGTYGGVLPLAVGEVEMVEAPAAAEVEPEDKDKAVQTPSGGGGGGGGGSVEVDEIERRATATASTSPPATRAAEARKRPSISLTARCAGGGSRAGSLSPTAAAKIEEVSRVAVVVAAPHEPPGGRVGVDEDDDDDEFTHEETMAQDDGAVRVDTAEAPCSGSTVPQVHRYFHASPEGVPRNAPAVDAFDLDADAVTDETQTQPESSRSRGDVASVLAGGEAATKQHKSACQRSGTPRRRRVPTPSTTNGVGGTTPHGSFHRSPSRNGVGGLGGRSPSSSRRRQPTPPFEAQQVTTPRDLGLSYLREVRERLAKGREASAWAGAGDGGDNNSRQRTPCKDATDKASPRWDMTDRPWRTPPSTCIKRAKVDAFIRTMDGRITANPQAPIQDILRCPRRHILITYTPPPVVDNPMLVGGGEDVCTECGATKPMMTCKECFEGYFLCKACRKEMLHGPPGGSAANRSRTPGSFRKRNIVMTPDTTLLQDSLERAVPAAPSSAPAPALRSDPAPAADAHPTFALSSKPSALGSLLGALGVPRATETGSSDTSSRASANADAGGPSPDDMSDCCYSFAGSDS